MKDMRKMGVFVVVDEKKCYDNGCKPLKLKWVDKMKGEKCRSRLVCREIKRAKDRGEQLGPEDVFSPVPPSEGLKTLVSTMMTGHDDGNHAGGPFEMATWDVSRAHFYGKARRWIYTHLLEGHEQQGQVGQTLQEHVWNARCSVNLGRHVVRSVEGWFHERRNRVHRFLLQSRRRSQRIVSLVTTCA